MLLNRCAILIKPRKPFIEWADGRDEDGPRYHEAFDDEEEPVFLGPDVDSTEEALAFVYANFEYFFEYFLEAWHTHEPDWPQDRTVEMFKAWFDVRISSMVEDVVEAPLELE